MKTKDEIIFHMKSHPLWDEFERYLMESRPVIPTYDPNDDNAPLWRHRSGQREGFDILKNLLKIED